MLPLEPVEPVEPAARRRRPRRGALRELEEVPRVGPLRGRTLPGALQLLERERPHRLEQPEAGVRLGRLGRLGRLVV